MYIYTTHLKYVFCRKMFQIKKLFDFEKDILCDQLGFVLVRDAPGILFLLFFKQKTMFFSYISRFSLSFSLLYVIKVLR